MNQRVILLARVVLLIVLVYQPQEEVLSVGSGIRIQDWLVSAIGASSHPIQLVGLINHLIHASDTVFIPLLLWNSTV